MSVFVWQTLFAKYKDLFVCVTRHMHVVNSELSNKIPRVEGHISNTNNNYIYPQYIYLFFSCNFVPQRGRISS